MFRAHAEPGELARWWGPAGFTVPELEMDLRVGGRYRISMQPPEGELFHLAGEFREVDPPARLEYTFWWEEPRPDDRETVVAPSLESVGDSTRLILDQGPFATEGRHALHRQGWTESLVRLEEVVSDRAPRPRG